jgi:hypothetical protein
MYLYRLRLARIVLRWHGGPWKEADTQLGVSGQDPLAVQWSLPDTTGASGLVLARCVGCPVRPTIPAMAETGKPVGK